MKKAKIQEKKTNESVKIASPYNSIRIEKDVISVLRSRRLVQGKKVEEFERSLSEYIGCKNTICLNSGTAALHTAFLALKTLRAEKSEVITTPLSFAATANAVIHAGCKPVFVDIDEDTFNINPSLIEDKINERTLALEPVDIYGLPSDLREIRRIASSKKIPVVEDAAEAIGATYAGKKIGSFSTLSCFSTYATKNLHTAEGGFVTTDDDELARLIRLFRNQGQVSRYNQTVLGYNFRMIEICAAIGLGQLPILDDLNRRRRENAQYLMEKLMKIDSIGFQSVSDPKSHAWYMFALTLDESKASITRDSLVAKLKEKGVEADVAWPTPIHLQPYFSETFGFRRGDFPIAEKVCKKVFQLPIQPFLTRKDLNRIIEVVRESLP
ncbi:MAG: DegT/DnrJ/EryC1/StrS family aminotransferase [archaeon]|nr:DegT/DnrJ/EryC1/StrS family aminotransferase [archaeon]